MIGLGGMLGANARYLVAGWAARRFGVALPYGTFLINISGSLVLGFFVAYLLRHSTYHYLRLFFAVGFLGAYTTFSTFSVESLQLIQSGHIWSALTYMLCSSLIGLLGAWIGFLAGR
jgi:CrcB protein